MHTDQRCPCGRSVRTQELARPLPSPGERFRRRQPRLALRRDRAEEPDEHQVLVDLVQSRLGDGRRLREKPAASIAGEADAPPASPVHGGRRRLEGSREQHDSVGPEIPHRVGRAEPPAP